MRAFYQDRFAGLGGRMKEVSGSRHKRHDRERWKEAVRNFLLLANYFTHWKLAFLSSWAGLSALELEPPNAWLPVGGIKSDKFYSRLLNEREQDIQSVRLYKIGNYEISGLRGHVKEYVRLPRSVVSSPMKNTKENCYQAR
jgi:hypothetical protein